MTLDKLLEMYSGLLSRMRERDGNDELAKILDKIFMESLNNE